MKRRLIFQTLCGLWLALCAPAFAGEIRLGSSVITPGVLLEFEAPLSLQAKFVISRIGNSPVDTAKGGLLVPKSFDPAKPWPILIVSASSDGSGLNMGAIRSYAHAAAELGWIVLSADGPRGKPEKDDATWRWQMISTALEHIFEEWPSARRWPVACAGFSGGAKWSGIMASIMAKDQMPLIGVFMGGCNEDLPSESFRIYHPGEHFKAVPIFLSSGRADPIATPAQHAAVKASLARNGFKTIRLESYDGGHRPNQDQLKAALEWFLELSPASAPPAGKAEKSP